jgi:hypothetical protein
MTRSNVACGTHCQFWLGRSRFRLRTQWRPKKVGGGPASNGALCRAAFGGRVIAREVPWWPRISVCGTGKFNSRAGASADAGSQKAVNQTSFDENLGNISNVALPETFACKSAFLSVLIRPASNCSCCCRSMCEVNSLLDGQLEWQTSMSFENNREVRLCSEKSLDVKRRGRGAQGEGRRVRGAESRLNLVCGTPGCPGEHAPRRANRGQPRANPLATAARKGCWGLSRLVASLDNNTSYLELYSHRACVHCTNLEWLHPSSRRR